MENTSSQDHEMPVNPAGWGNILRIAVPLVLASSGHAIRLLADRIMLARYSRETISASMPAGLTCFVMMSFFIGTAGYVNAFVAQYTGARQHSRVGQAVWQGLYLAMIGGLLISMAGQFGEPLFRLIGHAPAVQVEQVKYFRILCRLSMPAIMLSVILCFWSGQGRSRTVMCVELFCALVNIALNYALIYGKWGCSELGIRGAGIATGVSSIAGLAIAFVLFFRPAQRKLFNTWPRKTFDLGLMRRLLRFGAPNGLQFFLDMAAFNFFILLLGRASAEALEATNMAFGLNAMAFIPVVGLGMTASILAGQCIGARNIPQAKRAVANIMKLGFLYTGTMALIYFLLPDLVLAPYTRANDPGQAAVMPIAKHCLRYIAAFLVFDAMYLVYAHAIRGAGDTRFAMLLGIGLSWGTLVLPCFVFHLMHLSVWHMWKVLVGHVILAGVLFMWRYRTGKWEHMRVIETPPAIEEEEFHIHA